MLHKIIMRLDSLDVKDRRLLLALDTGARKKESEIAKEIGLSKQVTNYRIKRLERQGIIGSYYAVIDHTRLGLKQFRVMIRLENADSEKEREIIEYLKGISSWIVTIIWPWNMSLGLYVRDEYELMRIWKEFSERYGYYVSDKWFSLITQTWKLERSFIFPKKKDRSKRFTLGTDPAPVATDETDRAIMEQLTLDARQSSLEIAKKIGQTERIVRYRIKRLEDEKVILGYRPFIDTTSLGLSFYKILIRLKDAKSEDRKRIREFVLQDPNIAFFTEAAGGHELEFEGYFTGSQELYGFIGRLRDFAPSFIKELVPIEYIREHKMSYYPLNRPARMP